MTSHRLSRWLLRRRPLDAVDPVDAAIEPLVRAAMVIGVATSILATWAGWLSAPDKGEYLRYASRSSPLQLVGLLSSLVLLQRFGIVVATRWFASFVTVTLTITSVMLGARTVAGSSTRLLVPVIVLSIALRGREAAVWNVALLAAAWLGVALPSFQLLAPTDRLEVVGGLTVTSVVVGTSAAILAIFRRSLRETITESIVRAQQIARTQRIDSLGRLAAGTAHDFNTLLGAMLMSLGMLRVAHAPAEQEREVRFLEELVAQARGVTQRLMQLARGEAGDYEEVFDLREVVEEVAFTVVRTLGHKVRLVRDLPERPASVHGNRVELRQVVTNLLMNAGDAVSGAGEIRITLRVMGGAVAPGTEGEVAEGAPMIELRVSDDGPGVAPAVRDSLFEPFVTTKPPGQGTGLGLSASLAIAHRHGGTLRLAEPEGRGACFALRLPLVGVAAAGES